MTVLSVTTILPAVFFAYVAYVHHRRYQRVHAVEAKFGPIWERNELTPRQGQQITLSLMAYDCPQITNLGAEVALIKAFIPQRMAELLLQTGQMKNLSTSGKRALDTEILMWTWLAFPLPIDPNSADFNLEANVDPRATIAVARVNVLHRRYKIGNEYYLYTLALLMHEPLEWTARYDWRQPTEMERDAVFIYWKEIGRMMDIHDLWETRLDMVHWLENFERELAPSKEANELVNAGFDYFLQRVPRRFGIPELMRNLFLCLVGENARRIAMLPDPPRTIECLVQCFLMIRKFYVRHLCLPRTVPKSPIQLNAQIDSNPRLNVTQQRPDPWYSPQPTGLRLLLQNLLVNLNLINKDYVPGPKWKSEGYRLEELGPIRFEKEGKAVFEEAARLQGAPITGRWGMSENRK